jgi:hypothetical protein
MPQYIDAYVSFVIGAAGLSSCLTVIAPTIFHELLLRIFGASNMRLCGVEPLLTIRHPWLQEFQMIALILLVRRTQGKTHGLHIQWILSALYWCLGCRCNEFRGNVLASINEIHRFYLIIVKKFTDKHANASPFKWIHLFCRRIVLLSILHELGTMFWHFIGYVWKGPFCHLICCKFHHERIKTNKLLLLLLFIWYQNGI